MIEKMSQQRAMKIAKEYQTESKKAEKEKLVILGKLIINAIRTGITYEDGRVRDFDIVDYYESTQLPFDLLFYIIRDKLDNNEQLVFRGFQKKYSCEDKIILDQLYECRIIFDAEFDQFHKMIEGSGREVTNEEKEQIINIIYRKNFPLTRVVYNALFDRWKNDFLDVPLKFNNKEKTLVRK